MDILNYVLPHLSYDQLVKFQLQSQSKKMVELEFKSRCRVKKNFKRWVVMNELKKMKKSVVYDINQFEDERITLIKLDHIRSHFDYPAKHKVQVKKIENRITELQKQLKRIELAEKYFSTLAS